jgi:hypothetical protein
MIRIGLATVMAAFFVAVNPAQSQPPTPLVLYGATHAQPVAGQSFAGLSIIPVNGTYIATVKCDAKLGRETLRARVLRYHPSRGNKPLAVTCSWRIPHGAHGKLVLSKELITATDTSTQTGPPFTWVVEPR